MSVWQECSLGDVVDPGHIWIQRSIRHSSNSDFKEVKQYLQSLPAFRPARHTASTVGIGHAPFCLATPSFPLSVGDRVAWFGSRHQLGACGGQAMGVTDTPPDVEPDAPGWHRAEVQEVTWFSSQPKARFFLLDHGQTTGFLDVCCHIRRLPSAIKAVGGQAKVLHLKGLVPVQSSVSLDMLLSHARFRPQLSDKWTESALHLVHKAVGISVNAWVQVSRDDEAQPDVLQGRLVLQMPFTRRGGARRVDTPFQWSAGQKLDLGRLLVMSEHAVYLSQSVPRPAPPMQPKMTLLTTPLTAKARQRHEDGEEDEWETPCGEGGGGSGGGGCKKQEQIKRQELNASQRLKKKLLKEMRGR